MQPADAIIDKARRFGFDAAGIADPDSIKSAGARLEIFLSEGRHGDMTWLSAKSARRRHPAALWPDVKSVIVLGENYGPADDPLKSLEHRGRGTISVYARGKDYHDVLKKRTKRLARWIADTFDAEVKVFVDTAPVMEKPLAEAAGIGWQGKHTNLVSKKAGSWLFLAAIFTNLGLQTSNRHADLCGSCHACLDICPTDAFPAPYQLDARRCISYLTIEHKGHIPEPFRVQMGNRIYGCDDCLAICPWNKFASVANEAAYHARAELQAPALADLAELDDASFRQIFAGSPIKRTGRDRFIRNVMIAIGNSGDMALLPKILARLDDDSNLVRAMAVWALGRLVGRQEFIAARNRRLPNEADQDVRREWNRPIRQSL